MYRNKGKGDFSNDSSACVALNDGEKWRSLQIERSQRNDVVSFLEKHLRTAFYSQRDVTATTAYFVPQGHGSSSLSYLNEAERVNFSMDDWRLSLDTGSLVWAWDGNSYYVAKVVDVVGDADEKEMKLHFEGFDSRYDIRKSIHADDILPLIGRDGAECFRRLQVNDSDLTLGDFDVIQVPRWWAHDMFETGAVHCNSPDLSSDSRDAVMFVAKKV